MILNSWGWVKFLEMYRVANIVNWPQCLVQAPNMSPCAAEPAKPLTIFPRLPAVAFQVGFQFHQSDALVQVRSSEQRCVRSEAGQGASVL